MTEEELVEYCKRLQAECYDFFDRTSAPIDDTEYIEMVDWIEDQLRKSTVLDLLDEEVVDILDENNAHMAASAVNNIIK